VKIEPGSEPAGSVNCSWVPLLMYDQLAVETGVDGDVNCVPCAVRHVGRQLNVTCDLSRWQQGRSG